MLIILTLIAIFNRPMALNGVQILLRKLGGDNALIRVASRQYALDPTPPPGHDKIVIKY